MRGMRAILALVATAVLGACGGARAARDVTAYCAGEADAPEAPHALYRVEVQRRVEEIREQVYKDEMGAWRSLRGVRLYARRADAATAAALEKSLQCHLARRRAGAIAAPLADDPLAPPEGSVVEMRVVEQGDDVIVTLIANNQVAAEQVAKRALALVERRAAGYAKE